MSAEISRLSQRVDDESRRLDRTEARTDGLVATSATRADLETLRNEIRALGHTIATRLDRVDAESVALQKDVVRLTTRINTGVAILIGGFTVIQYIIAWLVK